MNSRRLAVTTLVSTLILAGMLALSRCTASAPDGQGAGRDPQAEGGSAMPALDKHAIVHLSEASFDKAIGQGLAVVDFWASWCGPCRMMGPILEQVAAQSGQQTLVAKVDVDANPGLANRYQVSSIPLLVLFKDGREIDRRVGVLSASEVRAWIESWRR